MAQGPHRRAQTGTGDCLGDTDRDAACDSAAETQGHKATLLILHSTLNDETQQENVHTPSLVLPCCVPVVSDKLRVKCY